MSLREQVNQIVSNIANQIKSDDRITAIIWFGRSYWGTDEEIEKTGDIDIAVVVNDGMKMKKEEIIEKISDETKKELENIGKKLDIAILYPWHIKKIADIAIFGMLTDGCKIVYDKDGRVTNIINLLRNILSEKNFRLIVAGLKRNNKPLRIPVYNNVK